MLEQIELTNIDCEPAKRCSDFDEDCVKVIDPALCWIGNRHLGLGLDMADGYCPLMLKRD